MTEAAAPSDGLIVGFASVAEEDRDGGIVVEHLQSGWYRRKRNI